MAATPYLSVHAIQKHYGPVAALPGVDLDVERGAFVALLGPSGCGKSTLLRILAGLLDAEGGAIRLDGQDITGLPPWRRDIGLVFQNYALFPHMSVRENVRFGLDMRRITGAEAEARVDEALALVGLDKHLSRRPSELSGGQQQRVAIARAVAIRPRLLLLDEPLSNLDAVLRTKVRLELRELHDRAGLTTIMVTHDQAEALSTADRVAVMQAGRILQYDTPQALYGAPATAFVAGFIGSPAANLLPLSAAGPDAWLLADGSRWTPPATLAPGSAGVADRGDYLMALRPELLSLGERSPDGLPATIKAVEFMGGDRLVHVDVAGCALTARLSAVDRLPDSREVSLRVPEQLPLLFEAGSGAAARRSRVTNNKI